jgi:hypothetical protein
MAGLDFEHELTRPNHSVAHCRAMLRQIIPMHATGETSCSNERSSNPL